MTNVFCEPGRPSRAWLADSFAGCVAGADGVIRPRSLTEADQLASEVRRFILESTAQTGGHVGANLGTIELTIALHLTFDSPGDLLLFDTGHQAYTHKILTGRAHLFATLNAFGGMSRFVCPAESPHDHIAVSHGGTALSVALGAALARRRNGDTRWVVAIIGDGVLAEGMCLEALNHASVESARLMIVLNDNGYAISPGFGALHETLRSADRARSFFESLGCAYYGPVNGHDIRETTLALEEAKAAARLAIVHVRTIKGNGWAPADSHIYRRHYSFPFDPTSGALRQPPARGYPEVLAEVIEQCMSADLRVTCITPSTRYATGLEPVFTRHPHRCFDPGMCEQHALGLAAGLALAGDRPVVAFQSTFLQRGFDQLFHDLCFSNAGVLIVALRNGFSGYDSPSHHGIYDFSYLHGLPNLRVYCPGDPMRFAYRVRTLLASPQGPAVVLGPYGAIEDWPNGTATPTLLQTAGDVRCEVLIPGQHLAIIAVGTVLTRCAAACGLLRERGISAELLYLEQAKPLPIREIRVAAASFQRLVTVEEGVVQGGIGAEIAAAMSDLGRNVEVLRIGLPCEFLPPGSHTELRREYGIDAEGICATVAARWPRAGVA